jgi:hypothetical protein
MRRAAFVAFVSCACGANEPSRRDPASAPAVLPPAGDPLVASPPIDAGASEGESANETVLADDVPPGAPATSATPLSPCTALTSHQIKAKLAPLPDDVMAFGPDAYLAWGWRPGQPLELVTTSKRIVLASHAPKPNEPPWAPSSVHTSPDGRVVWSVPEGVFVHERGTTRHIAGEGSRSGVIFGDAVYYVKEDHVHVVDARGDRVVLKPNARVDGKVISSYVLRVGGGALGLEAHAEDVKVGPHGWSASVLGWIERDKLVGARILDTPIGAPDLHGDTYLYTDNVGQTQLFAFRRGMTPVVLLSPQVLVDGKWAFTPIHEWHWDGGPLFIGSPGRGMFRLDGCKLAPVAQELLRVPSSASIAADKVEDRSPKAPPMYRDEPIAKVQVGITIIHGSYGDGLAGDRAIVRKVLGGVVSSHLYAPVK